MLEGSETATMQRWAPARVNCDLLPHCPPGVQPNLPPRHGQAVPGR